MDQTQTFYKTHILINFSGTAMLIAGIQKTSETLDVPIPKKYKTHQTKKIEKSYETD